MATTQLEYTVSGADTAEALGSGSVPVLATPRLIAWLEAASVASLGESIPPTSTTVGTHIEIRHRAPTPVGGKVTVRATLIESRDGLHRFSVEAKDAHRIIATGEHTRATVDVDRFLARLKA